MLLLMASAAAFGTGLLAARIATALVAAIGSFYTDPESRSPFQDLPILHFLRMGL
jgi:hypothetical protein